MLAARLRLIAAVVVGVVLLTVIVVLAIPRVWTSAADVFIDYKENDPVNGRSFSAMLDESYMQTQVDMIKSQAVAERLIRTLGLAKGARSDDPQAHDKLIQSILRNVEVTSQRTSRVLSVSFSAETPEKARDYANAIVNSYIGVSQDLASRAARQRSEQYNAQLEQLRGEVDNIQEKLTRYQQETGLIDAQQTDDLEARRLNQMTTDLLALQNQLQAAQARSQANDRLLKAGSRPEDLPLVSQSLSLNDMKEALNIVNRQIGEVRGTMGPNHPTMQGLMAERQQLQGAIARQARTALVAEREEPARLQAQIEALQSDIDTQRTKVIERLAQRDRLVAYQRQLAGVEQVYNTALQKYDSLLMASNVTTPNLSILRAAETPIQPSKPRKTQSVILSMVVGLVVGVMLALLLELKTRRVRCARDVEQGDPMPLVGRIGFAEAELAGARP